MCWKHAQKSSSQPIKKERREFEIASDVEIIIPDFVATKYDRPLKNAPYNQLGQDKKIK